MKYVDQDIMACEQSCPWASPSDLGCLLPQCPQYQVITITSHNEYVHTD